MFGRRPVTPSTQMLLHMNESAWTGSANDVLDASGNANHGTSQNGAAISNAGKFQNCGNFDGVNDRVRVAHDEGLRSSANFSFGLWFKINSGFTPAAWDVLIRKDATAGYADWRLGFADANSLRVFIRGSTNNQFDYGDLSNSRWYWAMVTFDSPVARLYLDGIEVANNSQAGSYPAGTSYLWVANASNTGYGFGGLIDEAEFVSRTLSAAEIKSYYRQLRQYGG